MTKIPLHHSKVHGAVVSAVTAVGTSNPDGSPNYAAFAFVSWVNIQPLMICIGINKSHRTLANIRRTKQFSVNIGSIPTLDEVNFCGCTRNPIKNEKFDTFYHEEDKEKLCPMAGNLPVCMSFSLVDIHEYPTNCAVIGKVEYSVADDSIMDDKKKFIEIKKLHPLLFSFCGPSYFSVGEYEGKPWAKNPRAGLKSIPPKESASPEDKGK
ncbi:flavin reductase family protein [Aduncisulcus paluster]|uniref:Flavin reductase family protein n=1 Tax=Aduncisulcus paluster TaxID=2918883 RepID=A0ABQ5K532_9EUKA|nr:flavin reductase family protein [Aduncisulcus paluster]